MFLLLIGLFLQIGACDPVISETIDKPMIFNNLIKSYKNDLWGNVVLPEKWIHWKSIIGHKYEFKARTMEERVTAVKDFLPYLSEEDIKFIFSQITEEHGYRFVGPTLLVHDIIRVMEIDKKHMYTGETTIIYQNEFYLRTWWITKLPSSYSDHDINYNFFDKSIAYAMNNWGHILLSRPPIKRWGIKQFVDTAVLNLIGHCKYVFYLYIVNSDGIDIITHDEMLFDELVLGENKHEMLFDELVVGENKHNLAYHISIYDGAEPHKNKCGSYYAYGGPPIDDSILSYLKENEKFIRAHYNIPADKPVVPDEKLLIHARQKYLS